MGVRISLCMIVRDEIDCLERCLDSAAPWVDEIVIVDTGSVDGTWPLVQLRAHRSVQITWPDHFAKARNVSLDLATGDWVLILDADEFLASGGPQLRAAAEDPRLLAAELQIENELGDGEVGTFAAARFFRRLSDIRFEGRIHEQVAPLILQRCTREPHWKTRQLDTTIRHTGYVPEVFERRGKAERNVRLLETALHELPSDAKPHERIYLEYKLSTALGAGAAGQNHLLRAARMVLDLPLEMAKSVPIGAEILITAAQAWCRGGECDAAVEAVDRADHLSPGHAMVWLVRGQALLGLSRIAEAQQAFIKSRDTPAEGFYFDRRTHDVATHIGLAEVAHRQEDHVSAVEILEALKARHPGDSNVEIAWVHSMIRAGQKKDAMYAAVACLKAHPTDRNALLACAAAAEALGMVERAREWRDKALG